jgi:hypothetical protein
MANNMPSMEELMEKAKEMQAQMQKAQREIIALEVMGEAGGGLVKIRMNGAHQAIRVDVAPSLMGEDEDMLEDLIAAAINDCAKKIEDATKQKMMGMAKEMNLPTDLGGEGSEE